MKDLRFYKAQKSNNGSASQWELNLAKDCMFLSMAKQTDQIKDGNATFDWQNKLIFKINTQDISEILAVLLNMKSGVGVIDSEGKSKGLFHANKNGNAILYLAKGQKTGYYLSLSIKKDTSQEHHKINHSLSDTEGLVLEIFLKKSLELILFN